MIEELKLIVEMLNGVQESVLDGVLIYLGYSLVRFFTVILIIYYILSRGAGLIRSAIFSYKIRDIILPDRASYSFTSGDERDMIAVLKERDHDNNS